MTRRFAPGDLFVFKGDEDGPLGLIVRYCHEYSIDGGGKYPERDYCWWVRFSPHRARTPLTWVREEDLKKII